jgi:hypothetical protein
MADENPYMTSETTEPTPPPRDFKAEALAYASPAQLQNAYHNAWMRALSECSPEDLEKEAAKRSPAVKL